MARRNQLTNLIKSAEDLIVAADKLHSHVTKNFSTAASRIPGFVFHCSKIEVGGDGYMYDWAFIQIDEGKLETKDVTGNMVFVGASISPCPFKDSHSFLSPLFPLFCL